MPTYEHYKVGEYKVVLEIGLFACRATVLYFHSSRVYTKTSARRKREQTIADVEASIQVPYTEWVSIPVEGNGGGE